MNRKIEFTERDLIIGLAALVGGIISTIVVALPLELFLPSAVLVGIVEEPAKVIGLIIIVLVLPDWLTSKTKCALFGGLAGLGFAFTENLWYYLGIYTEEELAFGIIGRTFLCIPSHILGSAIVGMGLLYIAAKGKEGYKNAMGLLFVAIILHGLWNAVLVPVPMLIMDILIFGYIYKKLPEYPVPEEQIGILRLPKREVRVTRDRTFGRNDFRNDVPFEELPHLSKKHFKVTRFRDEFFIEDCGSKGGTKLNGAEIKRKGRRELRRGDAIILPAGLSMKFVTKVDVEKVMDVPTFGEPPETVPIIPKAVVLAKLTLPNNREIEIREKEREFGREDFKDVVSGKKLRFISRRHFKIEKSNGDFHIKDLGSANGTTLNGEEIKGQGRRKLKDRDEILIAGILKIRYVIEQASKEGRNIEVIVKYCPKCGNELEDDAIFCPKCGIKIKEG